jgi:ATP-binding protein involved in chromosome partitioning
LCDDIGYFYDRDQTVITLQDVAVDDACKGLRMFGEHDTNTLGIVKIWHYLLVLTVNRCMISSVKAADKCLLRINYPPFFASLPLDPQIRTVSDDGDPAVLGPGATADAFEAVTANDADMIGVTQWRDDMNR